MYTNGERVDYITAVLELTYATRSGEDAMDQATDVIADVLHLCDARGWCAETVLSRSCTHHRAEVEEQRVAVARARRLLS